MSRNLSVQLAIAGLLAAVLIAVIIAIVQFNSIEKDVIEVKQKTAHNESILTQLSDKIERGIKVNGASNGGGNNGNNGGSANNAAGDKIDGNLLVPDPTPLTAPGAKMGGHLRLVSASDYKGFNRLVENGADVQELYDGFIGNKLAHRQIMDPDKWASELARAVTVENDGMTYHVWLHEGVTWHKPAVDFANPRYKWLDGEHIVKAQDFAFMMQMLMDPKVEGAASSRTYFEDFDRLEIINDYEFKAHWKRKTYSSLATTLEGIVPLPEWLYAFDEDGKRYPDSILGLKFNSHWYNDRGIGSGPYRFAESKPGEYVKLVRNESYFEGQAAIAEVSFQIVKDDELRLLKFKRGEIDVTGLSPTQYRKEILEPTDSAFKSGKFKYETFIRLVYYYMGWNADGQFFGDKLVRRAMTHAFNRLRLINEVFVGLGEITTGNFHSSTPYYDKSIEPWEFNLDKAKALLDEAGWKDTDGNGIRDKMVGGEKKEFEFSFLIYSSSPEYKTMADIFKEDLIKIGVKMNVQAVDWPTMQKKMDDKEFDAFTGGWGLDWESDPYQLWHSTQADVPKGSNRVGFRNKEADEIIEKARVTFDPDERKRLFNRFHAIMHDEQPYTFFRIPFGVLVWQPRVQNVIIQKVRPQVLYRTMWLDDAK